MSKTFDPFNDIISKEVQVHIRLLQRSAKKNITVIECLDEKHEKKLLSDLKSSLGCSGTVKLRKVGDKENRELHFSGDQRSKIQDYLLSKKIVSKENLSVHGF